MSGLGKKAVVYGPLAKVVWDHAGSTVTAAAKDAYVRRGARRKAIDHADTLKGGAVLRVVHAGEPHWVVFSDGSPVGCYPDDGMPIDEVLESADMSKLMTPDQARLRAREARAQGAVGELRRRVLRGRRDVL